MALIEIKNEKKLIEFGSLQSVKDNVLPALSLSWPVNHFVHVRRQALGYCLF